MNKFAHRWCRCLILAASLFIEMRAARAQTDDACNPVVPEISLPANGNSIGAEKELRKLYDEDQSDRIQLDRLGIAAWPKVHVRDIEHREHVLRMLVKAEIISATEMYLAAFIFQHGSCSDDYALANRLAEEAIKRGSNDAKWLYAASIDRYLISNHRVQKFGTQFRIQNGKQRLLPHDETTTDAERKKYNVPALAAILKDEE